MMLVLQIFLEVHRVLKAIIPNFSIIILCNPKICNCKDAINLHTHIQGKKPKSFWLMSFCVSKGGLINTCAKLENFFVKNGTH